MFKKKFNYLNLIKIKKFYSIILWQVHSLKCHINRIDLKKFNYSNLDPIQIVFSTKKVNSKLDNGYKKPLLHLIMWKLGYSSNATIISNITYIQQNKTVDMDSGHTEQFCNELTPVWHTIRVNKYPGSTAQK